MRKRMLNYVQKAGWLKKQEAVSESVLEPKKHANKEAYVHKSLSGTAFETLTKLRQSGRFFSKKFHDYTQPVQQTQTVQNKNEYERMDTDACISDDPLTISTGSSTAVNQDSCTTAVKDDIEGSSISTNEVEACTMQSNVLKSDTTGNLDLSLALDHAASNNFRHTRSSLAVQKSFMGSQQSMQVVFGTAHPSAEHCARMYSSILGRHVLQCC